MEIIITIRYTTDDLHNTDWWAVRRALEVRIWEQNLGRINDAGMVQVVVWVDEVEKSKAAIEAILSDLNIADISTIQVIDE